MHKLYLIVSFGLCMAHATLLWAEEEPAVVESADQQAIDSAAYEDYLDESAARDPFEVVNRGIFGFNESFDRIFFRPVARFYVDITPNPVRIGVNNFLGNLFYSTTIANDFLQAKPQQGVSDIGRFLINMIVGFGGIFDPASAIGIPSHDEDFGQTLGTWGLGSGPYLILPLLGPSSFRDAAGRVADYPFSPFYYIDSNEAATAIGVLGAINVRANFLQVDRLLQQSYDPYAFQREAYLTTRDAAVKR